MHLVESIYLCMRGYWLGEDMYVQRILIKTLLLAITCYYLTLLLDITTYIIAT